ncbi:MAG: hypothetical protein HYX66_02200 [Ignavibacteria bacterium]|nr:hypothetical protein [Ignavibacteria bacterium]
MRTDIQLEINNQVTENSYRDFINSFNSWLGSKIDFRVAEIPIVVSHDFRRTLESSAVEILLECLQPNILAISIEALKENYTVPHETTKPLFCVADFAVCRNSDNTFIPRLIELQGFPSLFGYQYALVSRYQKQFALSGATPFLGEIEETEYFQILRDAIFADQDPTQVALVELDPESQKTRPDFIALEKFLGLRTVNIRNIYKQGRQLVFRENGKESLLKRIFNRTIVDELEEAGVRLNFRWTDDIDVEWAGHPNWFFRISKFLLPYLKHVSVPRAYFLSDTANIPPDLENYVLKPLYSFAGKGVNLNPTPRAIDAIEAEERPHWILQQKVVYDDCVPTPYGNNKVEVRIIMVWFEDAVEPKPIMSLVRMGRGDLMGARYNTAPWTGSSGCLFVE